MKERQRWQPEEDALLRAYVKQYGAKEWNLVSQRMGKPLHRDAKSCLERWKNYLKPGIKKGSLTPEEQSLVISLQAKYGNKWKKIASELPGRTAKRLGKWWEVFKDKQLKDKNKPPISSNLPPSSSSSSLHSQYDHILQTFAEKYVQPNLHRPPIMLHNLALVADQQPVLTLAGGGASAAADLPPSSSSLPPWLSSSVSPSSSSSSTVSPSVSLTLSPSEPGLAGEVSAEAALGRMGVVTVQQLAALMQCCKEVEEGRQSWVQHKKEATWRLSRLEQQLESEKARKRREKMEEVEAKIRALREEERTHLEKIESECREQLGTIQRDAESKEAKMVEMWAAKHLKLVKLVEQMGIHHPHLNLHNDLH